MKKTTANTKKIILAILIGVTITASINLLFNKPRTVSADTVLKFDEGYGTTIKDSSGTLSGSITNAVWKTNDLCFDGKCLYFDGSGDYISFSDNQMLDIGAGEGVTIQGWFRTPDISSGTRVLVAKYETTGSDGGYKVYMNSSGQLIFGIDNDNSSFPSDSVTSTTAYDDNRWHFFAAVKNGTSSISLYVDNILVGTDSSITSSSLSNNDTFYIGIDGDGSSNGFSGFIDEVRVLRSARTESEIKTDYLGASISTPGAGPVGYWKLDEAGDATRYDYSGNGNDLIESASDTVAQATGKYGYAADFEQGDTEYLEIADANQTGLDLGNSFTLMAWLNVESSPGTYEGIISKSAAGNVSYSWQNYGQDFRFWIENDGFAGGGVEISTSNLDSLYSYGEWNHFAITYNGFVIRLYKNGVEQVSGDFPYSTTITPYNGTAAFRLGHHQAQGEYYDGLMDEVKVYNYARTQSQVVADMYEDPPSGVAASFGPDQSYLSDGLVGYWKMDESSGTSITDYSGNGATGTFYEGTTSGTSGPTWTIGKYGAGTDFAGTNDVIRISENNANDLGDINDNYTVSAWFKTTTNFGSTATIIAKSATGGATPFELKMLSNETVSFNYNDGSSFSAALSSSTYNDGIWHQAVGTRHKSLGKIRLFIDGVLVAEGNDSTTSTLSNDEEISIGNSGISYNTDDFTGQIDEVRLYNRALSPAEVAKLYSWAPGPVAHWKMDENTGTGSNAVKDTSGYGLLGTMHASMTGSDWVPGKMGSGLNFDGTDDLVTVADSATLDISGSFTLSAWFKADTIPGTDDRMFIMTRDIGNNANYFFDVFEDNLDCGFYAAGSYRAITSTTANLSADVWYHATCVFDDTNNIFRLYLNGAEIANQAETNSPTLNNEPVILGAAVYGAGAESWFSGTLDDIKIYNYARTPAQIIEDMNGGHPAPGSPVGSAALWWKFDHIDGDTAINSGYTGSTNNGGIDSNCTRSTNSIIGSAIYVGSTSCYIGQIDPSMFDGLTAMTISLWINPATLTAERLIMGKSQYGLQENFQIWTNAASSSEIDICIASSTSDNCGNYFTTSGLGLVQGTWTHVLLVYDGSKSASDRVKAYKNGLPVSGSITGTIPVSMTTGTTSSFSMGLNTSGTGQNPLLSYYDELKIYTTALNSEQAKVESNRGSMAVMGALSTDSSGNPSWSAIREFCPPGNTEGNCGGSNDPSPSFWYKMDENTDNNCGDGAGTDVCDSTTNQRHGTNTNMESSDWVPGKLGGALSFDGVDEFVEVTDHSANDISANQSFTLQSWVYIRSFPGSGNYDDIVQKSNAYWIEINDTNDFNFGFWDDPSYIDFDVTTPDLQTNTWYHLTGVYEYVDGTNNLIKIYLNGYLVYSTTTSAEPSGSSTDALTIGAIDASTQQFNGLIDDVRYYKYARTPAQVAWDYNRGKPVGWWKMDESSWNGTAFEVKDSSGNAMHGTRGGDATTTTGKLNNGGTFDGSGDYVSVTHSTPQLMTSSFSLALWFNATSWPGSGNYDSLVSKNDFLEGYWMEINNTDDINCGIADGGSEKNHTATNFNGVTGTWYHAVCVFDTVDNTMKIYINGTEIYSAAETSDPASETAALSMGAYNSGSQFYEGKLDDIRIYNYPLTSQQIKLIVNEGAVRFGPNEGTP